MKTPAGTECPYFYADYYRGRDHEECRLINSNPQGGRWTPDLCASCPVPRIVLANACPDMVLKAEVKSGFLRLGRGVKVSARCMRSGTAVDEPEVGCGLCHQSFPEFTLDEDSE